MNSNQKRILLAVDGSNQSLEAVHYVSRLFTPQETEVVLFHVFSRVPEFFYDLGKEPQHHQAVVDIRGWERALQDSLNKFLSEARQILIDSEIPDEAKSRAEEMRNKIIEAAAESDDAILESYFDSGDLTEEQINHSKKSKKPWIFALMTF